MGKFITYQTPVLFLVQLKDRIRLITKDMDPYIVALSEEQKKGRSMACGREGMVKLISKIALAHPESLERQDNPDELEARLRYDSNLEEMRQSAVELLEAITETQLANSMDAITFSDRYLDSLQKNRDNNSELNLALRAVDDWARKLPMCTNKEEPAAVIK